MNIRNEIGKKLKEANDMMIDSLEFDKDYRENRLTEREKEIYWLGVWNSFNYALMLLNEQEKEIKQVYPKKPRRR